MLLPLPLILLPAQLLITAFVAALFFGDSIIIGVTFIAAQRGWSLWSVFWGAFAGTLFSDIVWFYMGKHFLKKSGYWGSYLKKHKRVAKAIDTMAPKNILLSLLYMKFLYGTHILTTLYTSWRNTPFYRFLFFDIIGIAIWLIVIIAIGWLAGKEALFFTSLSGSFESLILMLSAIIITMKLLSWWVTTYLSKNH